MRKNLSENKQPKQRTMTTEGAQLVLQQAQVANYAMCITHTVDNKQCKDCCDMLETDWQSRKACRDSCAVYDFSQNTEFILVEVVSVLGPEGDYSLCTVGNDERACKACCDSSTELAGGDRRFCRNTCKGLSI